MNTTLAFDIYGTLIDTVGVAESLKEHVGDQAMAFAGMWREKQLEYSFRRGLMKRYENFTVCTEQALEYVCVAFRVELTSTEKDKLMAVYRVLPSFPDVQPGLELLKASGIRMFAFSNGYPDDVDNLLRNANIRHYFEDIVSVHEITSFKPDPAVYAHFLQRSGSKESDAWLISSNPFDVLGAISTGMNAAWVKRSDKAIFDPWGIEPTLTISSLQELGKALSQANTVES